MPESWTAAGTRVAEERQLRGWNQETLAHEAGVAVKTLSRYENAHTVPERDTIEKIARALGLSPDEISVPSLDELTDGIGDQLKRIADRVERMPTPQLMDELRGAINQLEEDREAWVALVEAWLNKDVARLKGIVGGLKAPRARAGRVGPRTSG